VLLEQFVDGFVVCWKRLVVGGLLASFIILLRICHESFCSLAVLPCFKPKPKWLLHADYSPNRILSHAQNGVLGLIRANTPIIRANL
jgi:hypothetical protein